MLNPAHMLQYVIRPTLVRIGMHSLAAERLMLVTAIAESGLKWLHQIGGGPALGLYQIEPATLHDVVDRYLAAKRPDLMARIRPLMTAEPIEDQAITNLAFATAAARLRYWMVPERMPAADDAEAMGAYHKRHFNSHLGAADPRHTAELYRLHALG